MSEREKELRHRITKVVEAAMANISSWSAAEDAATRILAMVATEDAETLGIQTREGIQAALVRYHCCYTIMDDGGHLPLADRLASGDTVDDGYREIEMLADYLCAVVLDGPHDEAPPEHEQRNVYAYHMGYVEAQRKCDKALVKVMQRAEELAKERDEIQKDMDSARRGWNVAEGHIRYWKTRAEMLEGALLVIGGLEVGEAEDPKYVQASQWHEMRRLAREALWKIGKEAEQ